jgi:DNA-binding transcriptional MerR regulator
MVTWQHRIQSLLDAGFTLQSLADQLEVRASTLNDLHKGHSKSPRGDLALAIDALYRERCAPPAASTSQVA